MQDPTAEVQFLLAGEVSKVTGYVDQKSPSAVCTGQGLVTLPGLDMLDNSNSNVRVVTHGFPHIKGKSASSRAGGRLSDVLWVRSSSLSVSLCRVFVSGAPLHLLLSWPVFCKTYSGKHEVLPEFSARSLKPGWLCSGCSWRD